MLKLERYIALMIMVLFLIYGYTAWFVMDDLLPPILRFNPIWPSSFPKIISVIGVAISLMVIITAKGDKAADAELDINQWRTFNVKGVSLLLGLMVLYAIGLRPLGFLIATPLFLFMASFILGERQYVKMAMVSLIAATAIWSLVDSVLGIYLHPLPLILMNAGG